LGDLRAQAYTHGAVAFAQLLRKAHADAHHHLVRSLLLYREIGDVPGQARAELNLGWICEQQQRPLEALEHAQESLRLHEAAGHETGRAFALNAVGWSHGQLGRHRKAIATCRQALAIFARTGNVLGQSVVWNSLGYLHRQLDQYDDAIACHHKALELQDELGDRPMEADILVQLGDAQFAAGRLDLARRAWQEALAALDRLNRADADDVRKKLLALDDGLAPPSGRIAG
jgi:tetratricopeptide (TPR) repeat protein